jgi:aryl carrier-like protein
MSAWGGDHAGHHRRAVQKNGTSATFAFRTALFSAYQSGFVAQEIQQRLIVAAVNNPRLAVDSGFNSCAVAGFAVVAKIPTGATGKIERIRLATQLAESLKPSFVAPRDGTEAQVSAIFSEVLGIAEVGVEDNFFAQGGDSLRGFQALARIRARLRVDLSILDLFKGPTVAQVAREVARAHTAGKTLALHQILDEVERLSDEEAGRRLRG